MGRFSHLFVRVELGLGCDHRGEFLGCLLLGDGDARASQRRSGLHPGSHLSRLVVTVRWVPHGSDEERQKLFRLWNCEFKDDMMSVNESDGCSQKTTKGL